MDEHDPLGAVSISYETADIPHADTYNEGHTMDMYDVKPFNFDNINQNTDVVVKQEPFIKIDEEEKEVKIKIQLKKRKRKIPEDPNAMPYYCCSVCDERYTTIQQLQRHVVTHKGRVTSWDLRVQSKKMRKKMKKEKKRLKKIKLETVKEEITSEVVSSANLATVTNETNENTVNGDQIPKDQSGESTTQIRIVGNKKKIMKSVGTDTSEIKAVLEGIMEDEKERNAEPKTFCDKQTQTSLNLERIFKCGLCNKQFNLGYYLKLHVRSHTGEKPYACDQCPERFITASKLGRHRKRAHTAARAECRICHKRYSRLEFLVQHFNRHHAEEKIEGEPYDYNAILPYLKELEEELQRKREEEIISKVRETIDQFKSDPRFDLGPSGVKEEVKEEAPDEFKVEVKLEADASDGPPDASDGLLDASDGMSDGGADAGTECTDAKYSDSEYLPDAPWVRPLSPAIVVTELPEINSRRSRRTKVVAKVKEDSKVTGEQKAKDVSADPLRCDICNKSVSSLSYMRIHMRTHTGDKPYKCHICSKSFITSSKIKRHLLTHVEQDDAACEDSEIKDGAQGTDTDSKPRRKRRRRNVQVPAAAAAAPAARRHACQYCGKRFMYEEALQLHMTAHNDIAPHHTCAFCLARLESAAALAAHAAQHTPPRPYLCTHCGKTYKKRASMIYHRRTHTADPAPLHACPACPRAFRTRHALARHAPAHAPRPPARYPCPVCAHAFRTRYHAAAHLASHAREGLILEEHRGQLLAMIMQNVTRPEPAAPAAPAHLPDDDRSRVCNICGEMFPHFFYLEQHLKTHASQLLDEDDPALKKHICQVCNKGFKLSYYLKLHSFTHTKERPYICQQCGKGFITKGKLRRHMETHAGLKKYQCHVCCKFFTRPSYLRIHVRTIHGTQDYGFKPDAVYDAS